VYRPECVFASAVEYTDGVYLVEFVENTVRGYRGGFFGHAPYLPYLVAPFPASAKKVKAHPIKIPYPHHSEFDARLARKNPCTITTAKRAVKA
jgi:hypothetical protein